MMTCLLVEKPANAPLVAKIYKDYLYCMTYLECYQKQRRSSFKILADGLMSMSPRVKSMSGSLLRALLVPMIKISFNPDLSGACC